MQAQAGALAKEAALGRLQVDLEGNEAPSQVRQARAQIGAQAQDQMLDARLPHHYLNRRRLST